MNPNNFGSIDIEELRDYREQEPLFKSVNIYEEETLKNRSIGFIWDNPERIIRVGKS